MKIIQLSTVHSRNDTRIAVKQCPAIKAKWGSGVVLVVADGKGGSRENGVHVIDVGEPDGGHLGRAILGSAAAFTAMRRFRPNVVHFHDPELIPVGILCKLIGLRVVYDVHENVPETIMKREWIPRWMRKTISISMAGIEKIAGRVFDRIVVATPAIERRFPKKKTVLIQNFPIKGELTMAYGEPYKKRLPEFAYVGGITRERSAIEMIQALSRLNSKRDVKLHMAGNFRSVELQKEVEKEAGWYSVVFHGWVGREKMAIILGRARAGLVLFHPAPNHVDSQPNKLFEYMSAGLPVIASDFPLWRNIIESVDCGLLVDPQDSEAIAGAMQWILENPKKARELGENGKRAVEEIYNWEAESKKLIVMYDELLSNAGSKGVGQGQR